MISSSVELNNVPTILAIIWWLICLVGVEIDIGAMLVSLGMADTVAGRASFDETGPGRVGFRSGMYMSVAKRLALVANGFADGLTRFSGAGLIAGASAASSTCSLACCIAYHALYACLLYTSDAADE